MFTKALQSLATASVLAASVLTLAPAASVAGEQDSEIGLTYVWTAHPGMEERLVKTYEAVGEVLEANEPGLLHYEIAVSESGNQIVIYEVFEDGDALAFHLTETAAKFFPELVTFANPGPFIFRGDVPEELRQAAYQMEMGAIFTGEWTGFTRN